MLHGDLYGNEGFEYKKIKKSTEMYPISLKKGAQIYCEDHPGKTTEGNVRKGKKKKKVQRENS